MPNPQIEDDAHHAEFVGVELLHKEGGGSFLVFKLKSLDEPLSVNLELEIPQHWEHSIAQGADFDPMSLPEHDNDMQQTLFRKNVANRKNDAWLQRLVFHETSVARRWGKNPKELEIIRNPQNMDDYVKNLWAMLEEVECILLRRSGDVWDIIPEGKFDEDDDRFDGYRLAWRNKELEE